MPKCLKARKDHLPAVSLKKKPWSGLWGAPGDGRPPVDKLCVRRAEPELWVKNWDEEGTLVIIHMGFLVPRVVAAKSRAADA